MNKINNHRAQTELLNGSLVIIDVREPAEFKEFHIPGALNIPSSKYKPELFSAFEDLKIGLVCQSGQRAIKIETKLLEDGFKNIYLLKNQMQDVPNISNVEGWSIDRQFRFLLGILLALYTLTYFLDLSYGIAIPIILSAGLTVTAIINRCYLRIGIGMLPWNSGKKIPD